jgi:hypothetical protein
VELLYRLWIKALLRPSFRPHSFLPFQFGAGIAVVELVIWTVQRAIDNSLGRAFTHLISLDFINAFNTADRQGVCLGNAPLRSHPLPRGQTGIGDTFRARSSWQAERGDPYPVGNMLELWQCSQHRMMDRAAAHLCGALNSPESYKIAAGAGPERCIPHCNRNTSPRNRMSPWVSPRSPQFSLGIRQHLDNLELTLGP